ncbi:MAG: hypothetical protein WDZ59_09060 [Pirellulales bacterium]
MPSLVFVSAMLLIVSAGLILWHLIEWRKVGAPAQAGRYRDFVWRRFRRRVQASGLIGVIGLMILASRWIDDRRLELAWWLAILLFLFWLLLMALGDALSSRNYYQGEHRRNLAEQEKLHTEIRRAETTGGADSGTPAD